MQAGGVMGVPAPVGVPAAASAPVVQPVASNVVTIEPLLEECI